MVAEDVAERFLEEVVGEAVDDGVDGAVSVTQHRKELNHVDLPAVQRSHVVHVAVRQEHLSHGFNSLLDPRDIIFRLFTILSATSKYYIPMLKCQNDGEPRILTFLPRDAMLARYSVVVSVRPSGCVAQ